MPANNKKYSKQRKKIPDIVIIYDLRVYMHEVQLVVFVCWVNFGKVDVIWLAILQSVLLYIV